MFSYANAKSEFLLKNNNNLSKHVQMVYGCISSIMLLVTVDHMTWGYASVLVMLAVSVVTKPHALP